MGVLGVLRWLWLGLVLAACQGGPTVGAEGSTSTGSEGSTTGAPGSSGEAGTESSSEAGTESSGEASATDPDSSGGEPACGNGIVEGDEDCDDRGESATCDADCTAVECGDGLVNAAAGEVCDGDELGGATCRSEGFDRGTLACGPRCSLDTGACVSLPGAPALMLSFAPVKRFDFSWAPVAGTDYYRLEQSPGPGEPYVQLGSDIVGESVSHVVPLHLRYQASYVLWACNDAGCTHSAPVAVMDSLVDAVGYVKASNTDAGDIFGIGVALSGDGSTLAVGAFLEASGATGIDGDQASDAVGNAGAVYVYTHDGLGQWSQQAYIKASNTGAGDQFGRSVALSEDGSTLAVGANGEASSAVGIDGDQASDAAPVSGAVYVFVRDGLGQWSQQAYIKASNTGADDQFGNGVGLSDDGNTLAVGAPQEDGNAMGINGAQGDGALGAGAVYVFVRDPMGQWSQQAYVKASNTNAHDEFGEGVALSGDGDTLAVGALGEDSNATGINGAQGNDFSSGSGAAYVFTRDGLGQWSQQAYVKASNTGSSERFGAGLALSDSGDTLAVGATAESSSATGINGDQINANAAYAGATYVFVRDGLGQWSQQAYVKASNTDLFDSFGYGMALSGDGDTLAVASSRESSAAVGLDGNQGSEAAVDAGAIYVYERDLMGLWSQSAYVKASNTGAGDYFGYSVAMSEDGHTLAAGAWPESSSATGIDGDQADDSASEAGAVYLF